MFGIEDDEEEDITENDMVVISNNNGINGACEMINEDVLNRLESIFHGDFYILPSSIHELIAIKAGADFDSISMREMVTEVNSEVVALTERLSDNAYIYSVADKKLAIA